MTGTGRGTAVVAQMLCEKAKCSSIPAHRIVKELILMIMEISMDGKHRNEPKKCG